MAERTNRQERRFKILCKYRRMGLTSKRRNIKITFSASHQCMLQGRHPEFHGLICAPLPSHHHASIAHYCTQKLSNLELSQFFIVFVSDFTGCVPALVVLLLNTLASHLTHCVADTTLFSSSRASVANHRALVHGCEHACSRLPVLYLCKYFASFVKCAPNNTPIGRCCLGGQIG